MEAGGHIGPVSTSVLAQDSLPELADEHLVFVAGGIGRGEAIAGYLEMGAAGVQPGTRFACAAESSAYPDFKKVQKRVVQGKRVSRRVDLGGACDIKKKKT